MEYLKNDGTYEDLATLPDMIRRAAQCGVIHCELHQEHVRQVALIHRCAMAARVAATGRLG